MTTQRKTGNAHLGVAVLCILFFLPALSARATFPNTRAWAGENANGVMSAVMPDDSLDDAIAQAIKALGENPESPEALDNLASLYVRKGDFREAGRSYTQRLKLAMLNPAAALPYVICIWHVRQEYEAQAAMLRGLAAGQLTPGQVKLLENTLDFIYDPQNVVETLKPEFAKPEELRAIENIREYWLEVCRKMAELENSGSADELVRYASSVFGATEPARAWHALWRAFALAHRKKYDEAETELRVAALDVDDPDIQPDIVTATGILRELRKDPQSGALLDTLSDVLAGISSAAGKQLAGVSGEGAGGSIHNLLNQAAQANEERKFDDALRILRDARQLIADSRQQLRFISLNGAALWGVREYARANQDHVAVSVFQKERYVLSDALFRMAEYAAMQNNPAVATEYAVRSAGLLRDSAWKLRQVGSFFIRLDITERGIAYLERSLETSDTLMSDADSYSELATAYKRIGKRDRYLEYAASYVETIEEIEENGNEVTPDQNGLRHYFKGELLAGEKDFAGAYGDYERAAELIKEPYRLSEILMVMAEYQATARNNDKAEELAERSNSLLPRQPWKLRQVGHLLTRVNKNDKALRYFEEALEYSFSFQDRIQSYAALTDAHLSRRDRDQALRCAREYISLVKLHRDRLSDAEEGLAAFYQGEIYALTGQRELAYPEYERALKLLDNRFKRAEVFMKMAEYQLASGSRELAGELAGKSAAEVPDQAWKLKQAGDFFLRVGSPEKAEEYYRQYVMMVAPEDRLAVHAAIADAHGTTRYREQYARYARIYIDAATENGRVPTEAEQGLAAYYQGEIAALRGDDDAAYRAYEKAAESVADKPRLADIYMKMARIDAKRGNKSRAAELAEKAAALVPDNAAMQKRAGDFLGSLGMADKAVEYLERLPAAETADGSSRYQRYAALAEAQKNSGNRQFYLKHASDLATAFAADAGPHSPADEALAAYYTAEVRDSEGKHDEAYRLYEKAAGLTSDDGRRIDCYLKMAEHKIRLGDRESAAALTEKAAGIRPDDGGVQQRAGDIFLRLNDMEKALDYYLRYEELSASPAAELLAYSKIADTCKRMRNPEKQREYAGKYVELAGTLEKPSDEQRGLTEYYRGEIALLENDLPDAREAYGKAAELIGEKYRLSEILMTMADIENRSGNRDVAATLTERSLALLPNEDWKIRQAADMFVRLNMPEKAVVIYEDRLAKTETPKARAEIHSRLADIFRKTGDRDNYLRHAAEYAGIVSGKGYDATAEEIGLGYFYQGERHFADKRLADAAEAYGEATGLITDKNRLAETYMRMADLEAERGDKNRAAEMTGRALALLPQNDELVDEAAAMFVRLEMPERAVAAFRNQIALADTPRKKAAIYLRLAATHQKLGQTEMYADALGAYLALLEPELADLNKAGQGEFHYYRGEYHRALKQNDQALAAYEKAAELISEKYRLSDTLMRMANILAYNGDDERAATLAQRATDLLPDADWRTREAAALFVKVKMRGRAVALFERKLRNAATPGQRASAYADLANLYKEFGDRDEFARHADYYIATVFSGMYAATAEEMAQALIYRGEILMKKKELEAAFRSYADAAEILSDRRRKASILLIMAGIRTEQEQNAEAAELIERALGAMNDDVQIVMDAAHAFNRLGRPLKAGQLFDYRLEMAKTPAEKAGLLAAFAYAFRDRNEREWFLRYAERYIGALKRGDFEADREALARRHFFQAELHLEVEGREWAARDLVRAYELFSGKDRKYETLMLLAKVYAQLDNGEWAANCADLAATIFPDQHWKLREVGQFFLDLGSREKALDYFGLFLVMAKNDKEKVIIYSDFAEVCKRMGRNDEYVEYARLYADAVERLGDAASNYEKGYRFYFLGEIYSAEKDPDKAYEAYETAAVYLNESYRLSVIYTHMARYHANNKNADEAATFAAAAASQTPGSLWQVRGAAEILSRVRRYGEAESVLRTAIFLNPAGNVDLYDDLSQVYGKAGRRQDAIEANRQYIDGIHERVEEKFGEKLGEKTRVNPEKAADDEKYKEQILKLWTARERHAGLTRLFPKTSWETSFYGREYDHSDNKSYGIYSELANYFWYNRRLNGKLYAIYEASVDSYYTGFYRDRNYVKRPWATTQRWGDTDRLIVGVAVNPFVHPLLRELSFNADQIFGLGRQAQDDFRLRVVYDRGSQTRPRPFGRAWHYWKIYSSTNYSFRDDNLTSAGSVRRGVNLVSPWDRNLMIIPYGTALYTYGGRDAAKSTRWGFDAGAGINIKKYYGETKYRTAFESVEVDVYYRWGLTHNRKHGFGFSVSTKF